MCGGERSEGEREGGKEMREGLFMLKARPEWNEKKRREDSGYI